MGIAAETLTQRVPLDHSDLSNYVESAAQATNRPRRPLHLQALLQLPRIADPLGFVPTWDIENLLFELARELPAKSEWLVPDVGSSPRSLRFKEVEARMAYDVMRRFHYLHSPRTDGRAYGLWTVDDHLVAICVSSPLDVMHVRDLLVSSGRSVDFARVISRVFVFEGAPTNTISYMLSRVARMERQLGVTDLVTYVNPNMMFTGASYRASGWQRIGEEQGTRYRYLDERYITDRELAARFGPYEDRTYQRLLGSRFAYSIMPLKPLLIFHIAIA